MGNGGITEEINRESVLTSISMEGENYAYCGHNGFYRIGASFADGTNWVGYSWLHSSYIWTYAGFTDPALT